MQLVSPAKNLRNKLSSVSVFANVKNEKARLPFFLQYYRDIGISEFYIVDNNSKDGTRDYLELQPDVTLYFTNKSFAHKMDWMDQLRNSHGVGRWCLTVDCDELLKYPLIEKISLPVLCDYLESQGYKGMFSVMLDCYPNGELMDQEYIEGESFLSCCDHFDREGYFVQPISSFPYFGLFGGPRYREFYRNTGSKQGPVLRKLPLVKWGDGVEYFSVNHSTTPLLLADITGAILHFKFLDGFYSRVTEEEKKKERLTDENEVLANYFKKTKSSNFMTSVSEKYRDSAQLVEHGLIKNSQQFMEWATEIINAGLNKIERSSNEQYLDGTRRASNFKGRQERTELTNLLHFWEENKAVCEQLGAFEVSVVIPVYNAEKFLLRAVKSALRESEVVEIILAEDGSTDSSLSLCQALAQKHSMINLVRHPGGQNRGAGQTRNLGIKHSNCEYIAFLDADDFYLSGRFRSAKKILLSNSLVDAVYGVQSFEFESDGLRRAREEANLPMVASLEGQIAPSELFRSMNPIGKGGWFHGNTLTIKKSSLLEVGNFTSLRCCQDVEMWLRMAYSLNLVSNEETRAISSKYVHANNRMSRENTRKYRARVLMSVLEFASLQEYDREKLVILLRRYFDVLNNLEYEDINDQDKRMELSKELKRVINTLGYKSRNLEDKLLSIGQERIGISRFKVTRMIKVAIFKSILNDPIGFMARKRLATHNSKFR